MVVSSASKGRRRSHEGVDDGKKRLEVRRIVRLIAFDRRESSIGLRRGRGAI
jgi:hypothetical protein